jgi:hypothetical protein
MKFAATIARMLRADMQAELRDIERAVASGTRDAGRGPQGWAAPAGDERRARAAARQQLARQAPNQRLDAASLVYSKAPQIIRAFDDGAVIRSGRGRFLAIPTENAPGRGPTASGSAPARFRSTASGRSGSCLGRADPLVL